MSKQLPIIETERLRLRQWRARDAEYVIEFYSDAEISKFVGGPRNPDSAWSTVATMIGHWEMQGFGYFAVEEKASENFVGSVGLWQSPGWPELELAYWLMEQQQGKGYGREAADACIGFARNNVDTNSLVSYIDKANMPSIALAKSLGAKYDKSIELDVHGPRDVYRYF